MRQAIHILKKDIRHLWGEIVLVLVATGLFVLTQTSQQYWQKSAAAPQTVAAFLVSFLLPICWGVLIVRAVHAECLVGDREFWQTRPYAWKSLLTAKLLLILLFLNLPLLVAQSFILRDHGFRLNDEISSLIWNQVLLTVGCLLPVAVLGALTSGIAQFLLVALSIWAGLLLLSLRFTAFAAALAGGFWGPIEWVRTYYSLLVAGLAAAVILVWQYKQRRTVAARFAAALVVVVVGMGAPISWSQAFTIQTRFSRQSLAAASAIRAGWNTNLQWMTRALIQSKDRRVSLNVPLQLSNVPDNLTVKAEGLTAMIEAPGGLVWRADGSPTQQISATGQLIALRLSLDDSFYLKIKDHPIALRGQLFLTLYGNRRETKVPLTDNSQMVPGMGMCSATGRPPATYFLSCYWALRPRADRVSVTFGGASGRSEPRLRSAASYSPFPAELTFVPISPSQDYSTFAGPLDAISVVAEEPVAHVQAPVNIEGLRLSAYEATLK